MRKLKLQVQLTVDGFMAGVNGEMDWMIQDWDESLVKYVGALTEPVDCILLGRKLAEVFIPYWKKVAEDIEHPENEAGSKFTHTAKIVFSHTLNEIEGAHTTLMNGDLVHEVHRLKAMQGGDMIVYGGAGFVANLIKNNLIDDYHLLISPIAIGKGLRIFEGLTDNLDLKLVETRAFDCGIALLHYQPKSV